MRLRWFAPLLATSALLVGTSCGYQATLTETKAVVVTPRLGAAMSKPYLAPLGGDKWNQGAGIDVLGQLMIDSGGPAALTDTLSKEGVPAADAQKIATDLKSRIPYPAMVLLTKPGIASNHQFDVRRTRLAAADATAYVAYKTSDWVAAIQAAKLLGPRLLHDARRSCGWGPWDLYMIDEIAGGVFPVGGNPIAPLPPKPVREDC